MTRLCILIVLKGHIQLLLKSNNLQNVYTKKELWHGNLASVKYAPCTYRRSGNQMMMIKVRQTDCQLYACVKKSTIGRHGINIWQEIEMGF